MLPPTQPITVIHIIQHLQAVILLKIKILKTQMTATPVMIRVQTREVVTVIVVINKLVTLN